MAARIKPKPFAMADVGKIGSSMAHYEKMESKMVEAYEAVTGHEAEILDMEGAQVLEQNKKGIFIVQDGCFAGSKPVGSAFVMRSFQFPRQIAVQLWRDWQRSLPTADERRGALVWGELLRKELGIDSCKGRDCGEIARRMIKAEPAPDAASESAAGSEQQATAAKPTSPAAEKATTAKPVPEAAAESAAAKPTSPAAEKAAVADQRTAASPNSNTGAQDPAVSRDQSPARIEADKAGAQRGPVPETAPESSTAPASTDADTIPSSQAAPRDRHSAAGIGSAAGSAGAPDDRGPSRSDADGQGFSIISMPPAQPAVPTGGAARQGGVGNVVNPEALITDRTGSTPPSIPKDDPQGTQQSAPQPEPSLGSDARATSTYRNLAPSQDVHNKRNIKRQTQPERNTAMSQNERSSQSPKSKCFVIMADGEKGTKPVMVLAEQEDALDMAQALEAANAVLAAPPSYDVVEAVFRH